MEITITQIIKSLIKKWYILLIFLIISCSLTFVITTKAIDKLYQSTAKGIVSVMSTSQDAKLMSDNNATTHAIANSKNDVLFTKLSDNLKNEGYEISSNSLKNAITVSRYDKDVNILTFKCVWKEAQTAQIILEKYLNVYTKYMSEDLRFEKQYIVFTTSENPVFYENPISPNLMINMMLGAIIGFILGTIVIMLMTFASGKVNNLDDISKSLGTTILGEIPFVVIKEDKNHGTKI